MILLLLIFAAVEIATPAGSCGLQRLHAGLNVAHDGAKVAGLLDERGRNGDYALAIIALDATPGTFLRCLVTKLPVGHRAAERAVPTGIRFYIPEPECGRPSSEADDDVILVAAFAVESGLVRPPRLSPTRRRGAYVQPEQRCLYAVGRISISGMPSPPADTNHADAGHLLNFSGTRRASAFGAVDVESANRYRGAVPTASTADAAAGHHVHAAGRVGANADAGLDVEHLIEHGRDLLRRACTLLAIHQAKLQLGRCAPPPPGPNGPTPPIWTTRLSSSGTSRRTISSMRAPTVVDGSSSCRWPTPVDVNLTLVGAAATARRQ